MVFIVTCFVIGFIVMDQFMILRNNPNSKEWQEHYRIINN